MSTPLNLATPLFFIFVKIKTFCNPLFIFHPSLMFVLDFKLFCLDCLASKVDSFEVSLEFEQLN
jgi:hypothetical protein